MLSKRALRARRSTHDMDDHRNGTDAPDLKPPAALCPPRDRDPALRRGNRKPHLLPPRARAAGPGGIPPRLISPESSPASTTVNPASRYTAILRVKRSEPRSL